MSISPGDLKSIAREAGLDDAGAVPAGSAMTYPMYREWIGRGEQGQMDYLSRFMEARADTDSILPNAQTLIVVLLSLNRLASLSDNVTGRIRECAKTFCTDHSRTSFQEVRNSDADGTGPHTLNQVRSERAGSKQIGLEPSPFPFGLLVPYSVCLDYHTCVRNGLRKLAAELKNRFPGELGRESFRGVVDTAPILEKEWAARAGLGTIGRNSLLIHPKFGSRVFIGILLTTAPPEFFESTQVQVYGDPVPSDPCVGCTRCARACPAGAISENRTLHASRCLNYWLIEYKGGELPAEIRNKTCSRVFGCDTCQSACPYNQPLAENKGTVAIPVRLIQEMDEAQFLILFKGTPVERLGLTGLRRNAGLDC